MSHLRQMMTCRWGIKGPQTSMTTMTTITELSLPAARPLAATWSFHGDSATITLPASSLHHPDNVTLRLAIEDSHAAEHLIHQATHDTVTLQVTFHGWASIGRSLEHALSEEERDIAKTRLSALARLVALDETHGRIRLRGILTRERSALSMELGNEDVDVHAPWPTANGMPRRLSPLMAAVALGVRDYNMGQDQDVKLEAALLLQRRVAGARDRIELPAVLAEKSYDDAVRLRVAVEPSSASPNLLTVSSEVEDPSGARTRISLRSRRRGSAFVMDGARHIHLTETQRRALDELEPRKAIPEAQLGSARDRPELLLSPSAIDGTIEFVGYSERVLGFRERSPEDAKPAHRPSGVQWYEEDDALPVDGVFASFTLRDSATGAALPVHLATREEAERALAELSAHLAQGEPLPPFEWRGHRIENPAGVAEFLARKVADTHVLTRTSRTSGRPTLVAELSDAPDASHTAAQAHEPDWDLLRSICQDITPLPHQKEGIRWLWSRFMARTEEGAARGVLLADDMGLGKTFQIASILALVRRREPHPVPHLIVAPQILLANWKRELARYFLPGTLRVRVVTASSLRAGHSTLVDERGALKKDVLAADDIWLINYDALQAFGPALLAPDWDAVVLDEAQAIKNASTAASRNARGLKARFAIAATGTPVENRLSDLFALGNFAFPGVLANHPRHFDARFGDGDRHALTSLRGLLRYGEGAHALLLRREKKTLAASIPEKRIEVVRLPMTMRQHDLERHLVAQGRGRGGSALGVLANLQKLYQHPALLDPTEQADRGPAPALLAESPKLHWLLELLRTLEGRGEKVLIFTLWTRTQAIISRLLQIHFPGVFNGRNVVINGEPKSSATAQERIDHFSSSAGFDALVLSPLAAGLGLTITAATHVVHYGRWWNPAREDQATDRAHRIGQTRPVTVWIPVLHHPATMAHGFDVRLHELVERKRQLAADFLTPAQLDVQIDEWASIAEAEQA